MLSFAAPTNGLAAHRFEFDLDTAFLSFVKRLIGIDRRPKRFMLSQNAQGFGPSAAHHEELPVLLASPSSGTGARVQGFFILRALYTLRTL